MKVWPLAVDTWGNEEKAAAIDCILEGQRTMGKQVRAFEEEFAEEVGSQYAIMVNSGSSANLLLAAALLYSGKLPHGFTVLAPALAWSTTYAPFIQLGYRVKPVDIDRHTLNMGDIPPEDINNTTAAIGVHALGNPMAAKPLHGMLWLEDCCEALGTKFNTTGGVGRTFSLYFSHQMTTGEGGMVATNNIELYQIMLSLRAHGWTRDWAEIQQLPQLQNEWEFPYPGFNLRPLELQGAVGRVQLQRLRGFIDIRRHNAATLNRKVLSGRDWIWGQQVDRIDTSSWMAFALFVRSGTVKVSALRAMLERAGIETRPVLAGNIARQGMAKWMDCRQPEEYPNAEFATQQGFMIGNSPYPLRDTQLGVLNRVLDQAEIFQ